MLHIEPKRIERVRGMETYGRFCLDDCIATYTNWVGRDYELMYVDSWNFKCNHYNKNIITQLDDQSYFSDKKKWDNLELHHGVKLSWYNSPLNDNTLKVIMKELKENHPIVLSLDCFYCPWDLGFQSYHSNGHTFLITDFHDNQTLNCVDPFFMKQDSLLPIKYSMDGFKGFATFTLIDIKKEYNLIDLINTSVSSLFDNIHGNVFTQMKNFAEYIAYSLDVQEELKGCKEFSNTNLWKAFELDYYGRIEYIIMLCYIARRLKFLEDNLVEISTRFLNIIEQWQIAQGMLGKIFMFKESQEIRKKLANRMNEIATTEEEIALELLNIQTKSTKKQMTTEPNICFDLNFSEQRIVLVDLSNFYNNQGFGTPSINCTADLTGMGQYFLKEDLPDSDIWKINEVNFKFPRVSERDIHDNISCMGQKIAISPDRYREIMILGCAEFGDYQEYINILDSEGEVEKVLLRFTDWFANPRYGEKIVWEGYVAYRNNNDVKFIERKHRIFMQKCHINRNQPLSFVILPECPNLHIFAITLIKSMN